MKTTKGEESYGKQKEICLISKINRLLPRVSRFQKRMATVHERIIKTENEQFVAKCQRMLVVNK